MPQKSLLHLASRSIRSVTRSRSKAWLIAAAVALSPAPSLLAETYASTLGRTPIEHVRLPIHATQRSAMSFMTDNQSYSLNSISLSAWIPSPDISEWGTLVGYLYTTDANGLPLALIPSASFSLTAPLLPNSEQLLTFNATSSIILDAGTRYAFSVGTADLAVDIGWHLADAGSGLDPIAPANDWSILAILPRSADGGVNWIDLVDGAGTARMMGAINATAIPEPSTLALLGAAGALGWTLRRRRAA